LTIDTPRESIARRGRGFDIAWLCFHREIVTRMRYV
jgi:hypothetical protein